MVKCLLRLLILTLVVFIANSFNGLRAFPDAGKILHRTKKHLQQDPIITASGSLNLCPGGSVILNANDVPVGASLQWLKDGVAITGATQTTFTTRVVGSFSVDVTNGGIKTSYPAVTVTANPPPTGSFTFDNNNTCSGTPIQFTSTVTTGISPFTYLWNFGDGQTSTDQNPTHTYNFVGCGNSKTVAPTLTITDANGCSTIITNSVNVLLAPDVQLADANIFNDFKNCQNNPTVANPNYTLKVNNISPSTSCISSYSLDWGDGTPAQNGLTANSFPLTHTYTKLGAFDLVIRAIGNNSCTNSKTYTVANQSNPAGGLGTLGATTGLCAPAAVPFKISNWQLNSPGTKYILSFGDGTSVTLTHPLNTTLEDQIISHTYTKSSCPASSFTATLNVINSCTSTPYTAGNIQIQISPKASFTYSPSPACVTQTVTFKDNSTLGYYGSNCSTATGYSWNFGEPASANNTSTLASPTHTYSTPGTYTVTLTTTNPCGFDVTTQAVIVNSLPVMTSATTAIICSGGIVNIPLTSDIPATYTWSAINNTSITGESTTTQTTNTLNNTLINTSGIVQIVTYTVTPKSTNGGCFGPPQTVQVTVNPSPVAVTVTTPVNYCVGSTATALTANSATGNTLNWYSTATGGTGSSNPPIPNTATAGTYNYYVSQVATNTSCESTRSLISVIVTPIPTAPSVGNAQIMYCQNSVATALTATVSSGSSLRWYTLPTGGVASTTAPIPNTSTIGTTTYYVSQITTTGCESPRAQIDVIVNANPDAPVVTSPIGYCLNSTAVPLTATASSGNGLRWYMQASGGTSSSTPIIPATTVAGTRTYYVSQISGSCESQRAVITVTINPKPAAPTVTSPQTYCVNDAASQLTATAASGNTLNWYSNAALTTKLTDAPTPVTTAAGSITYYVTQTNASGCESAAASITVTVSPTISNNVISADQTICYNTNPAQLRGVGTISGGTGTYLYQWQSSADGTTWANIASATAATFTPPALTASTQYRRLASSGNCSLPSNAVAITVQGSLTNFDIAGSQTICNNTTPALLTGQLPVGGNGTFVYQWQSSANNITWTGITGATSSDYQPAAITATTYFRRLTTSGICSGFSSVATITVNPNAKAEFTASATTGCSPFDLSKVIKPVLHDDLNGSYEWFANGVSIGKGAAFPGYVMKNDGESVNIKLTATSKFGCNPSDLELNFSTIKTVSASFTKNQTKGCGPITAHFVNTSQPLNSGTYKWDFGNGQTSTQTQPNDVTFLPHPQNRDTTYKITLAVTTGCGVNYFTDSIRVRAKPKAVFTPDKTIGCSPFEITLTNQSAGLPNTYTYYFGNGDKQVLTDNQTVKYTYTTTKTDTLTLKLVAENECGKDSSFYKIVVYPNNVQAKLVVNGDNQFGCSPVTVNFYNNSTGANSFLWDFGDGNTTTTGKAPDVFVHTFTKAGTYNVKLTASNGCTTASTNQIITVYAQPLAAFSIPKLQYCLRDSVAFINNSTQGNFSYRWDFGDGSFSNDNNPKHAYAQPGKYIITLTLTQSYANGSACTNTVSHTTEVLASPDAAFLSNAATLNCAPFTLQVVAAPVNALNPVWGFGDAASGTANQAAGYNASHTFTKAGVYRVLLTTYNQTGCADSTTQLIRITESPLAAFSPGDSILCGTTATVSFNNKTTYTGSVGYRWLINNTLVSTQKNLVYAFNPPTNATFPYRYLVKLIAAGLGGCTDTVTHQILLNGFPKAVFSVKNIAGCAPFKAEISNTSLYADQFKWYLNNKLVSTDQNPQNIILAQSASTYQLKLVVSNALGCKADSLTTNISTFAKPVAAFSLKDSLSCNGKLDVQISNKTTGATSYTWNFGDGTPEATTATPLHIYGVPGTYYLRLIAYNGFCRDTVFHTVKIASPPQAGFTADNLKGCTQVTATFQNISANATTYLWDFGDGTFSSGKNPTHTFNYLKSPFTIKLIATGEYGCADTTIAANYIVVSAPPKADFVALPDSVIKIPDYTFNFNNKSTGTLTSIKWDFGDGKTAITDNPTHTYLDTGTYKVKLTVINPDNCTAMITRTVRVDGVPGYLFVPNAFEPGNAKTELKTFAVRASGLSAYSLRIFNKWGEIVWQSDKLDAAGSPTESWDGMMHGQPAPQGVYVWYISAKFINGTEWKGMKYESGPSTKTGPIHLIR